MSVLGGCIIQFFNISELIWGSPKYDRLSEASRFPATTLSPVAGQGRSGWSVPPRRLTVRPGEGLTSVGGRTQRQTQAPASRPHQSDDHAHRRDYDHGDDRSWRAEVGARAPRSRPSPARPIPDTRQRRDARLVPMLPLLATVSVIWRMPPTRGAAHWSADGPMKLCTYLRLFHEDDGPTAADRRHAGRAAVAVEQ